MHRDQRLQEVVRERRVAADIPGHPQVMEWHKDAIRAHEAEPEVDLPQSLVHHSPGQLGEPEVSCSEDAKHGRHAHYHVEMADHEVSRMEHDVDGGLSQEEAAYAAADKHVMAVDHVAEDGKCSHAIDEHPLAKHLLAHVGDQDVGDDADAGHDGNVDLGVSEEPKQVLPKQSGSAGVRLQLVVNHRIRWDKEAGSGHVVQNDEDTCRQ